MKFKINPKSVQPQIIPIPEIGQFWKHKDGNAIYLRVGDELGKRAILFDGMLGVFYSLNVSTGCNRVVWCYTQNQTIEILNPVGGVMEFDVQ
jgi:hypothetical protein